MTLTNIITPEGEIVIKNFKYKGGSISYSYDLIWSPLAEYVLKYVPLWWAPNAITLAGFLINVLGCLSLIVQGEIGTYVNSWTLIFFSVCLFTYQTLDNIDGKQARKTGNSSPLGMLFDHGCDALALLFVVLAVSRIICF
jgi:ethanolaminephosphotransferase